MIISGFVSVVYWDYLFGSRHVTAVLISQPDEVYLNLVLEFIPDTVYRIERQHSKSKYIISVIQTKVQHQRKTWRRLFAFVTL